MFTKKRIVVAGLVAVMCFCFLFASVVGHMPRAMAANPNETTILSLDTIQDLLKVFGGASGAIAAFFAWWHNWADGLKDGALKDALVGVVGLGQQKALSALRNKSVDRIFRKAIREAAKSENDALFDKAFPIDPKIDGGV